MAQFLYWLDQGGLASLLHHAGPWAMVAAAGAANIIGISAILRHYQGRHDR
jgi:hypothetical protein